MLGPEEAHILRLAEKSRMLTNELAEMKFAHYKTEDTLAALDNRVLHLDVIIQRARQDRTYLETYGTLPLPPPPQPQ